MYCPTKRRNNVNQHYLLYSDICTCAGTKQLDIHKKCAVTLTGKRPPNRKFGVATDRAGARHQGLHGARHQTNNTPVSSPLLKSVSDLI